MQFEIENDVTPSVIHMNSMLSYLLSVLEFNID